MKFNFFIIICCISLSACRFGAENTSTPMPTSTDDPLDMEISYVLYQDQQVAQNDQGLSQDFMINRDHSFF